MINQILFWINSRLTNWEVSSIKVSEINRLFNDVSILCSTLSVLLIINSNLVHCSESLTPCKICGRRFAQDRITLHEKICAKTGQKKRKQFDAGLHRVQGTELEAFVKKGGPPGRQAEVGIFLVN